jgi:capsid protein
MRGYFQQAKRQPVIDPELPPTDTTWSLRRWDSAKTHRLNKSHWQCATGNTINEDLASDIETLWTRCDYESSNNPLVDGIINTFALDVAGDSGGPRLQVQSSNERYNNRIEEAWREFWEMPDANGRMGGAEVIPLWIRQLFLRGSYLNQKTSIRRDGPFELALRMFDARRLGTPPDLAGANNVAFGVELTEDNTPTGYHVRLPVLSGESDVSTAYRRYPAEMIQHRFKTVEPDQIIGVPWLACCLQTIADLRDYDAEVMEAARSAAAQSVFWYTNHPDAKFYLVNESTEIQRGQQQTGPPGWQPAMLQPTQPSTEYKTYRHERLREMGRAVNMPLMMVLLSSQDSNFASAHYDGAVYIRGIVSNQKWIQRLTLEPLLRDLSVEVRLAHGMPRPTRVTHQWTWPIPPYSDPKKQYEALRMRLEDGTIDYGDLLSFFGLEAETVIANRERFNEMIEAAGLPPLPVNLGRHGQSQQPQDEEKPEMSNAS